MLCLITYVVSSLSSVSSSRHFKDVLCGDCFQELVYVSWFVLLRVCWTSRVWRLLGFFPPFQKLLDFIFHAFLPRPLHLGHQRRVLDHLSFPQVIELSCSLLSVTRFGSFYCSVFEYTGFYLLTYLVFYLDHPASKFFIPNTVFLISGSSMWFSHFRYCLNTFLSFLVCS